MQSKSFTNKGSVLFLHYYILASSCALKKVIIIVAFHFMKRRLKTDDQSFSKTLALEAQRTSEKFSYFISSTTWSHLTNDAEKNIPNSQMVHRKKENK